MNIKKILNLFLCLLLSIFTKMAAAENTHYYQTLSNQLTPQVLDVPGGKIEYYRFGHGTPLVLITGYFANVKSWSMSFLKALSAEHDVIILDNRNVGGSINSSKNYKTVDLAGDVNYLLQSLNINHTDIFGVSMGGMIAQQYAISYPTKVDHLILMNTFIAGKQPALPSKQIQAGFYTAPKGKIKQLLMALRVLFPPEARAKMLFVFLNDRFNPKTEEKPLSPKVIKQQQNLVLAWMNDRDALQKIRKLKIPVLIMSGGSDYVIPPANSDVLKKEIPQAELIRWQDGGHAMIFQHSADIAKVINDWLQH